MLQSGFFSFFKWCMELFSQLMRRIFLLAIQGYRFFLSPWLGYHCRFEPTCSRYAEQAIENYGVFLGSFLSLKRLCRCHPFSQGGCDPLP